MRISVVIATTNRAESLRRTLDALRRQTHRDFEVVVVLGPGRDDASPPLADHLKRVEEPDDAKARNRGIDAAAGDVVAFLDPGAIPEPRWLEELAAAYDDGTIGGAGGLVYDHTGVTVEPHGTCDRLGRANGPDPFAYLLSSNASFRREALEEVGGLDEDLGGEWAGRDLALRLLDAGWRLRSIDGAGVLRKAHPDADPFADAKGRACFALRHGTGRYPMDEIFRSLTEYLDQSRRPHVEEGFDAGVSLGMRGRPAGRAITPRDPDGFVPSPTLWPDGRRLSLCFVSLDYPPGPMSGIARYTADLARGMAARGHEVHVVTRADPPYRLDLEDGVWVHRYPEGPRPLPALDGHPLRDNLAHCAAVWRAVDRADRRFGVDVVAANIWIAEALLCALDPRWPAVFTCSTSMRTAAKTQPALAAKPHTPWQAKLEDAALARAQHLQPVSHANLDTVRCETPAAADVPATVVWHGMVDRAGARCRSEPPVRDTGSVEILFVGRLEPRKGIDTLIEAAIGLLRERPGVVLRIAGADNPYSSDDSRPFAERVDARLADDPALRRRIVFEGEVSDVELDRLLASCDVFCAPSRYESFGLMNVEAMMFARPVVSCRAGGIPEVVADGETGFLVEPDDADGLRDALRRLVDDPELRARMGTAGRARFEREFDNDVAVMRTLAVHEDVLDAHGPWTGGADAAERALAAGIPPLLDELGDVAASQDATAQLLDPGAFPYEPASEEPSRPAPPAPAAAPRRRLARMPGAQRARNIGRRILRDPRVGQLDERVGRLIAEVRGIGADVDDLRASLAAQQLHVPANGASVGDPRLLYLMRALKPGQTAVDVGAGIGVHAILMASEVGAQGRVIAYEPDPDRGAVLRENLARHGVGDRVTVVEAQALDAAIADIGEIDLVNVASAEHGALQGMRRMLDDGAVRAVCLALDRGEWEPLLRAREHERWRFHRVTERGELEPAELETLLAAGRYAAVVMTSPSRTT